MRIFSNETKQRGNSISALIQSFQSGQAQKALNAAQNSDGSAEKEEERYLNSIEGKSQQVKASWQTLSQDLLSSDSMKGLLDGVNKFIESLDTVIEKFGLLKSLIAGISLAVFVKDFT